MTLRFIASIVLVLAGVAFSQEHTERMMADSAQQTIDEALVRSRAAIDEFGVTDSAMSTIQGILSELAAIPGIKSRGKMKELHGSPTMGRALLASENDSGICLYVSWFAKDAETPVHDHLTWGVIRVLEGKDKYRHWKRDTDTRSGEIVVNKTNERIIKAGESVYWLGPPNDIHSQQSFDVEVWELVMTGRDLSSNYVSKNQQRFDTKTGRAIPKKSNE
ncbi:MAG: hypothetical protein WBP29_12510 [Candidatus Zixiibacteriota bacterium]